MADKVEFLNTVCIKGTEKALLIRFETGEEEWIPQSQIDDDSEVYAEGDEGTLIIPEWIATERGLV